MKEHIQENGMTYRLGKDGHYYPNLKIIGDRTYISGKYGHLRKEYLKHYRQSLYAELVLSGMLHRHLHEVEIACMERIEILVEHMKTEQRVNEQLKTDNQLLWIGKMNRIVHDAEESVLKELIYQ